MTMRIITDITFNETTGKIDLAGKIGVKDNTDPHPQEMAMTQIILAKIQEVNVETPMEITPAEKIRIQ